jgi:hypothetical protein
VTEHRFHIEFGALSPRIDEQLRDQGLRLDMKPMARQSLQRDIECVTRLFVRGILTEAEAHKARRRIMQIIKKQARPLATTPTPEPPND